MLNVLFASNDTFSPFLGVSLYSLLENNNEDFEKISIHILDDKISESNVEKLKSIAKEFNAELHFINTIRIEEIVENKIDFMEKEGKKSLTPYARLFTSSLLPDIDKILYLDADSLIMGSFKELWELNLEDNYIGAVEDLFNIDAIKKDIGMEKEDKYINSGFLLMNLKKWREDNIEEKFFRFQKEHSEKFIYHDQGIINGVCKGKIKYLHPKYNLISIFHGIEYQKIIKLGGIPNFYDEKTVIEAQENPIFIHFSGGDLNRPWSNKRQCYFRLYWEYVNKTPFKYQIKPQKISFSKNLFYIFYKSRLLSILLKLLPMSLAVKIANKRVSHQVNREKLKN